MEVVAWISLGLAFASALIIVVDEVRRPQAMAVMNFVWPLTALYFSVLVLPVYFTLGRQRTRAAMQSMEPMNMHATETTWSSIALGASHCGAGCAVADVLTEFAVAASGVVLFGSKLATSYLLDFVVAWIAGVLFQYFAIKPMRSKLSVGQALLAAIKADTLSILAFQVGMYAFMAWVHLRLAPGLTPFDPRFWLGMQAAMICGFLTTMPMNAWLIRKGLKEAM